MTSEEYQRICERLARKALRYAAEMSADDAPNYVTNERAHWIEVFLDERLPDIDADVLLSVTRQADVWLKNSGSFYAVATVRAIVAFQADVWAAIHDMATT